MRGQIQFDITSDQNIQEMCEWLNKHKNLDTEASFNGRYISLKFTDQHDAINTVEK